MSVHQDVGWRYRAIALASLGAAALSRLAFRPADAADLQPLEMQVLVALALQDSLGADPPLRTGSHWLSIALRLEQPSIDALIRSLEHAGLVRRDSDPHAIAEIHHELAEEADEETVAGELPVAVTDLGFQVVDSWFKRTRLHFGGWPPERRDVDDAVG